MPTSNRHRWFSKESDRASMEAFDYSPLAGRVVFGCGTIARVAAEVEALGCRRAFVLSDPHHAAAAALRVRDLLGNRAVGLSTEAAMHTPVEVTEKVLRDVLRTQADCLISLGGGSTTGLGKALALRTDLPQVVIPTTYAGSEATPILGQTEQGRKTTLRTAKVLPETIIYDVDLTLGLPAHLSVVSGLNAIAHAVEALYAKDANPVTSMLAERGIEAIAHALPKIVRDGRDTSARSEALFGAWACGNCLGTVGMSLHHKLCHVLGGSFELPHAETHAVIFPMPQHTTRKRPPRPLIEWRLCSARKAPQVDYLILPPGSAHPPRCAIWGSINPNWTKRRGSRWPHRTGILDRSRKQPFAGCSITHSTAVGRSTREAIPYA